MFPSVHRDQDEQLGEDDRPEDKEDQWHADVPISDNVKSMWFIFDVLLGAEKNISHLATFNFYMLNYTLWSLFHFVQSLLLLSGLRVDGFVDMIIVFT
jgi:hypothetical protein